MRSWFPFGLTRRGPVTINVRAGPLGSAGWANAIVTGAGPSLGPTSRRPDAQASKGLYGGLFGWDFEDTPIPDGRRLRHGPPRRPRGRRDVETADRHPAWASYVTVDDADAATERAQELGANVLAGAFDVMDVGRMSTIQDPTGAVFCVWQPRRSIGAEVVNGARRAQPQPAEHVHPEAAERFYGELFGWRFDRVGEETPYWGIFRGDA